MGGTLVTEHDGQHAAASTLRPSSDSDIPPKRPCVERDVAMEEAPPAEGHFMESPHPSVQVQSDPLVPGPSCSTSSRPRFPCPLCPKSWASFPTLQSHIERFHLCACEEIPLSFLQPFGRRVCFHCLLLALAKGPCRRCGGSPPSATVPPPQVAEQPVASESFWEDPADLPKGVLRFLPSGGVTPLQMIYSPTWPILPALGLCI